MDIQTIKTTRLILRKFSEKDIDALYLLLKDEAVNKFLPWFPLKSEKEAARFFEERIKDSPYFYAICLKEDNCPIGYIKMSTDDSHDFGYALSKDFWHKGITTETGRAVLEKLKKDGISYITATHDVNNPRSGGVMQNLGMKYMYSYEEWWQPKDFPVIFRMYQLNLDGNKDRVYKKYWDLYENHFI